MSLDFQNLDYSWVHEQNDSKNESLLFAHQQGTPRHELPDDLPNMTALGHLMMLLRDYERAATHWEYHHNHSCE